MLDYRSVNKMFDLLDLPPNPRPQGLCYRSPWNKWTDFFSYPNCRKDLPFPSNNQMGPNPNGLLSKLLGIVDTQAEQAPFSGSCWKFLGAFQSSFFAEAMINGCFQIRVPPPIIHFDRVFHTNHPFWGTTIVETPTCVQCTRVFLHPKSSWRVWTLNDSS